MKTITLNKIIILIFVAFAVMALFTHHWFMTTGKFIY